MTDIITSAPVSTRSAKLLRLRLPRSGLGALPIAIPRLLGHVFNLAYVAPYTRRRPPAAPDNDSEGRDPNW